MDQPTDRAQLAAKTPAKATSNSPAHLLVERRDFLGGAATLAGGSLLGLGIAAVAQPPDASPDASPDTPIDRMPPIPDDKMTDIQKKTVADLVAGPRGALVGPFIPLLRSPDFMGRLQKTGEYLRYNTKLGPGISEFIILFTARQWTQQFEWDSHYQLAMKAGVKSEVIAAIADGRRPIGMTSDEELVYDFLAELHVNRSVSDPIYDRVAKRFGEQGVIDIVGITGYYSLLGMILNVARTPLPPGKMPQLAQYPH